MDETLQQIKGIYEFYSHMWQKLIEIETYLKIIERRIDSLQFSISLNPDDKIHEVTARELLGLKKKEFNLLKEQGLIRPINKKNFYSVKDVLNLKKLLQENFKNQ